MQIVAVSTGGTLFPNNSTFFLDIGLTSHTPGALLAVDIIAIMETGFLFSYCFSHGGLDEYAGFSRGDLAYRKKYESPLNRDKPQLG